MKDSRATQRGRILDLLIDARGEWVPLPKIVSCAAQYNARIFELRQLGFRIKNRTREVDGEKYSWFRLEAEIKPVQPLTAIVPTPETIPLFTEGGR